jgi:hypothetical protein
MLHQSRSSCALLCSIASATQPFVFDLLNLALCALRFCFFLAILTSAYLSIVGLAEVCASVSLGVFCGIAAASDISIVELSLS